jgi:hypothetical protein
MKPNPKPAQKEAIWPLILAAAVFIFGVYLVLSALNKNPEIETDPEPNARSAELTREQKIEAYKRQLGEKLNRDRTIAEHRLTIEDREYQSAPAQPPKDYRASLENLPMSYEHKDYAPREESKLVPYNPADHRVSYDLQEEQNAEFWEEEAQRMFLRQFVLNARAQGYDVAIDKQYNVIVRGGQRRPQNVSYVGPFNPVRYRRPFFRPPPYCH